jgi:hypothetical protein
MLTMTRAMLVMSAIIWVGCNKQSDVETPLSPEQLAKPSEPGVVTPPVPAIEADTLPPPPAPNCNVTIPATINVNIAAGTGPKGAATPVAITNNLYSMGIHDLTPGDFYPTLNSKYVAFLKALRPGMLRFPAGVWGQRYTWSDTGDGRNFKMGPAFLDAFINLCRAVGAEPFLAANIETPTDPSNPTFDAVQMLRYVNITKKYNVKWWQIGNEPNLPGTAGESPTLYPQHYLQWRRAMLAVDPSIKFVGLESYTGEGIRGTSGEVDWFAPFIAATPNQVDAIAWHYYALYSGDGTKPSTSGGAVATAKNLLQEVNANGWPPASLTYADTIIPYIRSRLASTSPKAQIWIDEFAEDSGTYLNAVGFGDTLIGALWAADVMGRYAEQGTDAIFHFIFRAQGGATNQQFGYTLIDDNLDPRPEYYTFWLMANHFGDRMVASTSDQIEAVAAHAALRQADGSLRVMLINKSASVQTVRLKLSDFAPVRASQYVISGPQLQGKAVRLNGGQLTEANIGLGDKAIAAVAAEACVDNTVTVPPFSVSLINFGVR